MQFLNTFFFYGLLGMALPFIIHFVSRRRYKKQDFPAIKYVMASHKKKSRSLKLSNLLLLILRSLLIFFLVFSLARPGIRMKGRLSGTGKPALTAGILIDNSASMSKSVDSSSFFQNAMQKALSIIHGLRKNDRIVLNVTCAQSGSDTEAVLFPSDPLTPAQAELLLKKVDNLPGRADVKEAAKALMQKMELSERPGRDLFF